MFLLITNQNKFTILIMCNLLSGGLSYHDLLHFKPVCMFQEEIVFSLKITTKSLWSRGFKINIFFYYLTLLLYKLCGQKLVKKSGLPSARFFQLPAQC